MVYIVHTDASVSIESNVSGCAYLITTPYTYVSSGKKRLDGMSNIVFAETISIGLAALYLYTAVNLTANDSVIFNTDSKLSLEFLQKQLKSNTTCRSKSAEVTLTVESLKYLMSKCKVSFTKVKGHKPVETGLSSHVFVDRLAKLTVRGE